MSAGPTVGKGWCFGADGADLGNFLGSLGARPRLLGLGEPMHGEEEFPRLRNWVFEQLVEREGYRSVAIESDCLAALVVDAYVAGEEGPLEEVMESGFSHGFGQLEANRELVNWMRERNRNRPPADRLRFYGFDAPTEVTGAASPRRSLVALHGYLATHLEPDSLPCDPETIDRLVGDDERWTDPGAAMDPSRSVGASLEARELRLLGDYLLSLLTSESPRLLAAPEEDRWRACLYGRTAAGLLRYHAAMADGSGSRAAQISRLMVRRDAMMSENLQAIAAREALRGPTLVFSHNSHLQKKHRSGWHLPVEWGGTEGETLVSWWSAGAIAAAQMGDRYAFLASALGSAPDRGLGVPDPDTLEGALYAVAEDRCIFGSRRLAETIRCRSPKLTRRTDASTNYFPLDPDRLDGTDGIVFVKDIPSAPISKSSGT
jgi:erythromycin esterase-like protein